MQHCYYSVIVLLQCNSVPKVVLQYSRTVENSLQEVWLRESGCSIVYRSLAKRVWLRRTQRKLPLRRRETTTILYCTAHCMELQLISHCTAQHTAHNRVLPLHNVHYRVLPCPLVFFCINTKLPRTCLYGCSSFCQGIISTGNDDCT